MPRPFVAPDPKDMSANHPMKLISPAQVLGFFNQENTDKKEKHVSDSVKEWYESKMKSLGWNEATFHGSQCVLYANVIMKDKTRVAIG
jgi:hypothetical protein